MRLAAPVAFVAGVCVLQRQAELPSPGAIGLVTAVAALALVVARLVPRADAAQARALLLIAAAAAAGFAYAATLSALRLADELPFGDEGKDIIVEGVVSSLPARLERGVRFEFDVERVLTSGVTVPKRVLLGWYSDWPELRPAERWQFAVRLKRPHGVQNPGGFDLEAWLLERNLRATGSVRTGRRDPAPRLVDPRVDRPGLRVERARHRLRDQLAPMLEGRRYGGVLMALVHRAR